MSIGSFCILKNEELWIGPHLMQTLPHIDQAVLFDGNSTDGTLDIIRHIIRTHPHGHKIKLVENQDPKDLQCDYVRVFNECLHALDTDLALFVHPDMLIVNPEQISKMSNSDCIAGITHIESFAGNPGEQLYRMDMGRSPLWKNIYRLKNPDLGAHYFGHYGSDVEDIYFSEITGDQHKNHAPEFDKYPYPLEDSRIHILHFSDVRPYDRRLSRMLVSMKNQNAPQKAIDNVDKHPRVSLESGEFFGFPFKFIPAEYPEVFVKHDHIFKEFRKCHV